MSENLLAMQRQVHQGQPHFQQKPVEKVAEQTIFTTGQRGNLDPAFANSDVVPQSSQKS